MLLGFKHIIDTGLCALTLLYGNAHSALVVHRQLFIISIDLLFIKINEEVHSCPACKYAVLVHTHNSHRVVSGRSRPLFLEKML